ncbi:MAG: lipase family protein [Bacteroidales bacterium]|nr:lipase family protein [Bacteroidales bacterium]MCD8394916.1 lipase family protein [Bacteroidales bacterium]
MKFRTLLFAALVSVALASCSDDDPSSGDKDDNEEITFDPKADAADAGDYDAGMPYTIDNVQVTAGESEDIELEEYLSRLVEAHTGGNADDADLWNQWLDDQLASIPEAKEEAADEYGANTVEEVLLGIKATRYTYTSVDASGQRVWLSGVVVYPRLTIGLVDIYSMPKNIIIGCHVTICSDKEAPSNFPAWLADGISGAKALATDVGMLALHAHRNSTQSLVIIPDYEGYGETVDRAHPYLYQSVTARQVLDGIAAGISVCKGATGNDCSNLNSISVGYSQGGSVSMAVHKYIETHGLADTYHYLGSVCGDGPYDPLTHMMKYVEENKVNMPCVLPLIIKGMVDANPYIKGKYTADSFMSTDLVASGALDDIASKAYTTDDINDRIKAYSTAHDNCLTNADGVCTFEKMVVPGLYKYFTGQSMTRSEAKPYVALAKALELNNLTKDWTPTLPMICFHSVGDEVVPFCNYESAKSAFSGSGYFRGVRYTGMTQSHVGTGTTYYLLYEGGLVNAVLNGSWKNWAVETNQGGI